MRKLPTSIEILGNKITVEQVDNLANIGDRFGDWCNRTNTIRVQSLGKGVPNDVIFATFYHEVTHAILDLTGHSDLSADESFVERVGQAFHHAEKSRRYGNT
jgi:hypothetical protein